jgi:uncharacterized protein YuzB (UPF0349 family)
MAHWCTEGCCSSRSPMYSRVHGSLVHEGVLLNSTIDVTASTWLTGARRGAAQLDHRCNREYMGCWCMGGCRSTRSPMYSRVHGSLVHGQGDADQRCNREYMAHWCTEGCCSSRSPMYSRVHGSLVHGQGDADQRCNREYMGCWCMEGCRSTRSPMYSRVHGYWCMEVCRSTRSPM